jgi:hypothetical protein
MLKRGTLYPTGAMLLFRGMFPITKRKEKKPTRKNMTNVITLNETSKK